MAWKGGLQSKISTHLFGVGWGARSNHSHQLALSSEIDLDYKTGAQFSSPFRKVKNNSLILNARKKAKATVKGSTVIYELTWEFIAT